MDTSISGKEKIWIISVCQRTCYASDGQNNSETVLPLVQNSLQLDVVIK